MVRSDVAAIQVYYVDHHTYAGMTVSKLRAYDSGLSTIEIAWGTKTSFCVQANVLGSWAYAKQVGNAVRLGATRCHR